MWLDGLWADVFLLAGGAIVAVIFGVAGGVWCASRPRSRAARAVEESAAMFFLCTPPYVLALGLLLLFEPTFGLIKMPLFFEVHAYRPPLEDPWAFTRSMLVPWLCVGAPLGAAILRLTERPHDRRDGRALGPHRAREGRPPPDASCAGTRRPRPTPPWPRSSAPRPRSSS